jgi:uncharacterized membrane protein
MSEKRFPWMGVALASLGLNLLIIGILVGALAAGARLMGPARIAGIGPHGPVTNAFMEPLSEAQRSRLRAAFRKAFMETAAERAALREARGAIVRLGAAEAYDPEAMAAAFASLRASEAAVAERFHTAIARELASLSPEERRAALRAAASRNIANLGRGERPPREERRKDVPQPDHLRTDGPGPEGPPQ